jgi:hypothetical protein
VAELSGLVGDLDALDREPETAALRLWQSAKESTVKKLALLVCLLAGPATAQELPIAQVRFVAGDVSLFAETTKITELDIKTTGIEVHFDKRDGPDRWPDNTTPGWKGPLQYSVGLCERVDGEWVCSAPIETWYGNMTVGGPIQDQSVTCPQYPQNLGQIQCNWFYDNRWAPLNGRRPAPGEQLGVFVVAGDVRSNYTPVRERSNIVLFNLPDPGVADVFTYTYAPTPPAPSPPAPLPAPPVATGPPPVTPTPSAPTVPTVDLSTLQAQIAEILKTEQDTNAKVTHVDAEVKTFAQQFGDVMAFVGKYIAPALAAWFTAKGMSK